MSNAREAILRQVEKGPGRTIATRTVFESSQVKLLVTDSGAGIPAHSKDRTFERFSTTKTSGRNLALSISREIIRNFRGHIEVHTDSMQGATFVAGLPGFQAEEPDPYRSAANQRIAPEDLRIWRQHYFGCSAGDAVVIHGHFSMPNPPMP